MKKPSKGDRFIELAGGLDVDGFTRKVPITEFVGENHDLRFGNGAGWARPDCGFGAKHNVALFREGKGNTVTHVQIQGPNKNPKPRTIGAKVKAAFPNPRCTVLDVGKQGRTHMHIDHKDGRYDDIDVQSVDSQKPEDFQPMSTCVNYAKRTHCKNCKTTGVRYDARRLGYPVAQVKGDEQYRGTCIGCYWFDPRAFNSALSFKT